VICSSTAAYPRTHTLGAGCIRNERMTCERAPLYLFEIRKTKRKGGRRFSGSALCYMCLSGSKTKTRQNIIGEKKK
jgi:hypothetical protein